jgi:hypothetical protein
LTRRNFKPVIIGLIVTTIVGIFMIWHILRPFISLGFL